MFHCGFRGILIVKVIDHNRGTLGGEAPGDGIANALLGAGDHCYFAFKSQLIPLSLLFSERNKPARPYQTPDVNSFGGMQG
jgi:hypothetical protein